MHRALTFAVLCGITLLAACPAERAEIASNDPHVYSLAELSVESLRKRAYGSQISIEYEVQGRPSPSYIASYNSDGLHVYARIDLPGTEVPLNGFPVVVIVHGWVGIDDAPDLDFYYDGVSNYSQIIDAFVDAGFAVFVPGWRGHGTINDRPADGIEFMQAWDNGSYVSPVFYAVDVLNLLDSLTTFTKARLDLSNVNLWGHSQGGDVALQVLAIAGEESSVNNVINAASIWSGNIPSRLVQLETFWPMQASSQAFMSGDGKWNGTAVGNDGSINPHFVFGYPTDGIATVNPDQWTWQNDVWIEATVADALEIKLEQMYKAMNEFVIDYPEAHYEIDRLDGEKTTIRHEAWVSEGLSQIGGFNQEHYLSEALNLHFSDRDFYSFPEWNEDLCSRVNSAAGECFAYAYPGNTHSLRVSEHEWFSPNGSSEGFSVAIQRDIELFAGKDRGKIETERP
jgi:pimeloyl-ACP methyl ester carboxylesterase